MSTGGPPPDEPSWTGGARIGRYTLVNRVGRGGMGEVWLATQTGAGGFEKRVALKRIAERMSADPDAERMFVDEARLAAHLSHPYIVQVFDFGTHDDAYFLAMEFLEGATLDALLVNAKQTFQPVPPGVAVRLTAQAADALHYAHTRADLTGAPLQIVHRDVSPTNLFVTLDGKLKVLDFGIARATVRSSLTAVGMVRGKLAFMAPEQVFGKRLDGRVDQYALGAVLFEWLTGVQLCPAKTLSEATQWAEGAELTVREVVALRPDLPPALAKVIVRAVAKDREARYASCAELGAALEEVSAEAKLQATHVDVLRWVEAHTSASAKRATHIEPPTERVVAAVTRPAHTEPSAAPAATDIVSPGAGRRRTLQVPIVPAAPSRAPRRRWPLALAAGASLLAVASVAAWAVAPKDDGAEAWPPAPRRVLAVAARALLGEAPPPPGAVPLPGPEVHLEREPTVAPDEPEAQAEAERPESSQPPAPARARTSNARRDVRKTAATPALGRVTLDSIPWSRVTMDGRELGVTPLVEHEVPAGRHTFRFVNEDGTLTGELKVQVPRGGRVARRITLAPPRP